MLLAQGVHSLYVPSTQFSVTTAQKKDFSANIGLSRGGPSGFEANLMRAMGDRWLLSATYASYGRSAIRRDLETGTQHRVYDLAGGYYEKNWLGVASILVGGGVADLYALYEQNRKATFLMSRYYVQPAMTFTSKYTQYGFSLRLNRIRFVKGDIDFTIDGEQTAKMRQIEEAGGITIPEIGLNAGFFFEPVVLMLYYSQSLPNFNPFQFTRAHMCISLAYQFRSKKGKSRK